MIPAEGVSPRLPKKNFKKIGQVPFLRPEELAEPDVPFVRPENIDDDVALARENPDSSVVSVTEQHTTYWKKQPGEKHLSSLRERRVSGPRREPFFRETGSIYVTKPFLLQRDQLLDAEPAYVVTDEISSFEVNSLYDCWLAEKINEPPWILFRVDGVGEIGMGHIYRCLSLAEYFEDILGSELIFLTDPAHEGGREKLNRSEYSVRELHPEKEVDQIVKIDPDIVFLDILDTDFDYVEELRNLPAAIINLEDLKGGWDFWTTKAPWSFSAAAPQLTLAG